MCACLSGLLTPYYYYYYDLIFVGDFISFDDVDFVCLRYVSFVFSQFAFRFYSDQCFDYCGKEQRIQSTDCFCVT